MYNQFDNLDLFERKIQHRYDSIIAGNDPSENPIDLQGWHLQDFDFGRELYKRFPLLSKKNVIKFWQYSDFSFSNLSYCNATDFVVAGQFHISYIRLHACSFYSTNLRMATLQKLSDSGFYCADLSFAKIAHTSIKNCNFNSAIMTGCNLTYTIIEGCGFMLAEMENVFLLQSCISFCNFTGAKNVVYMTFDKRGYDFVAVKFNNSVMIKAGCRWYNEQEAINHWGSKDYYDEEIGQKYLDAVSFSTRILKERSNHYGNDC